ncbi:TPA: hypothetical protein HA219_03775 [Candidatus Woesearchaeota archaeon]|nr:hypothetical protein [uncultured archaeon]HIH39810.1 hypothetical protein [Candidatus Woesearchaeota archaeon]
MSTLTLKFKGIEADMLDGMVRTGLFNSKSEAIRASLVHYGVELGLLREKLWKQIERFPRRKVSPKQLAKDIARLENAS